MEIIPAILTNDPLELDSLLRQIRDSKKFERVQIDFVDGQYVDNLTVKPSDCDLIPYMPLKYDAHLMVKGDNVLFWGKTAEQMGFDRVIYQIETVDDPAEHTCLAVDLETPVEKVEPYLKKLELVLLMAVPAGKGGQKFDEKVFSKIETVKKRGVRVCVDGGIEQEHLPVLRKLGVDEVAVGVKRVLQWK